MLVYVRCASSKAGLDFYNLCHNISELYNVLVQVRLTTSKTKRDI